MTLWRPPRSQGERAIRAIRSMQNGSIDGRIVSAYPVKPEILDEEEYDDYDELDETETDTGTNTGDGPTIKPWTDYYQVKGVSSVHSFGLTKTPYVQPKMSSDTRDYSSVHVYWNGVFQRDASFLLETSVITILDPTMRLRVGDTITVKYLYEQETGGQVDDNTYRMQCWFDRHDFVPTSQPGYYIFWGGVLESSPTGSNTGTITTTAGRYYTLQVSGGWVSKFKLPANQKIPVGNDVAGVTWRISYDPGADVAIDLTPGPDFYVKGNDYGTIVCHKTACGFEEYGTDGGGCGSGQLPNLRYDNTNGTFNPSFGPVGGAVFSSGAQGIELARYMNYRAPDTTWGYQVERRMPKYDGPVPYNAGCTYAGGIANAEDTVYGKHSHEKATYQVKIGVTATVIRK